VWTTVERSILNRLYYLLACDQPRPCGLAMDVTVLSPTSPQCCGWDAFDKVGGRCILILWTLLVRDGVLPGELAVVSDEG
jgi:hypothetical protein